MSDAGKMLTVGLEQHANSQASTRSRTPFPSTLHRLPAPCVFCLPAPFRFVLCVNVPTLLGLSPYMSLLNWSYTHYSLIGRRHLPSTSHQPLLCREPLTTPIVTVDRGNIWATRVSCLHALTCAHIASFRSANSCTAATLFMKMTLLSTTAWFSRTIGGSPCVGGDHTHIEKVSALTSCV